MHALLAHFLSHFSLFLSFLRVTLKNLTKTISILHHFQARREREEQDKMKQDSIKSAQHQQQKQQHNSSNQDHSHITSHSQHGGGHGGSLGGHLHHPSLVQNDLKLGLGGMGGLGGLGGPLGMMGGMDNKTNQDILKAVSKVNS
jgi:Antp family, other